MRVSSSRTTFALVSVAAMIVLGVGASACGGPTDDTVNVTCGPDGASASASPTASSSDGPDAGATSSAGDAGSPPPSGTSTLDPQWQRSNEYFLAPGPWSSPDLQYYTANTFPLHDANNQPAGASFTWTTSAWNGPPTSDLPGGGTVVNASAVPIPGFVAGDYWYWQCCDVADDGVTATTFWFRANVDLGTPAGLSSVMLQDKYHPGRITLNDGMMVFIDGVAQPTVLSTFGGPGATPDGSETGWSFDALSLPPSAFHDGSNEIAVMFSNRAGDGGLGHLVVSIDRQ
jgi:hypothetical protein